ncbi:Myb-DNA-bind-2 domain-containing protein [Mycena venus]|uniref:Myb-DNA-bind-2 domain-containing protein n=1 Tax=Mycena venus TaxID=2733690 RepID=A0A8H7CHW8_9AGAR|nr:Myb-DNA-bind-2 domain-containing protein [Mycena venus]
MWLPHSFILLLLAALASPAVTNTTIDDSDPSFAFTGTFWNVITPTSPCDFCSSKPDPSKTHGGTWHDGNINRNPGAPPGAANTSGSFTFMGTAVYIFGIDQAVLQPDIVFTLGSTKQVHRYAGTELYVYDALFFSAQGLASDQTHTVNWVLDFADTSAGVQAALFDYAIVTSGEDATETTTLGPVSSPPLTTSSEVAASNTDSLGSTVLSSGSKVISSGSKVLSSDSTVLSSGSTFSSPIPSEFTVTVSSGLTTVTAPAGAISKSKSNLDPITQSHLGPIIGGVIGGLAVIALGMLFVFIRLRRVRRVKSQTDSIARAQFLRIEDYPGNTRQIGSTIPVPLSASSPKKTCAQLISSATNIAN